MRTHVNIHILVYKHGNKKGNGWRDELGCKKIKQKMVGGNGKKKRERNEPATTNELVLQERSPSASDSVRK